MSYKRNLEKIKSLSIFITEKNYRENHFWDNDPLVLFIWTEHI